MSSVSGKTWRELIEQQFPALRPVTAVDLGEGCDSIAVEVNGRFVFRFPKRADVEQQLAIEARILPELARTSPLSIPVFQFFGEPSAEWPRHFVGYPKLPGRPAIHDDFAAGPPLHLAPQIGRFLSWLHALPLPAAEGCGVPRQSLDSLIDEVRTDALDDLPVVAAVVPEAPIDAVRRYLREAPPRSAAQPVLVHNDFAAEHVLLEDAGRYVTGVIDWSDIAISEPAADFAGIFHWGGDSFADAVLASYDGHVDDGLRARAHFMAVCRGVMDIAFGRQFAKPEYVRCGLRALRSTVQ
jgi:aminoglycoside phosphotransferase (APT) family kinase protein